MINADEVWNAIKNRVLRAIDERVGVGSSYIPGSTNLGGFTYLQTPKTSTSWDGDLKSTTAKTLLDLPTVFGTPTNAKAVLFKISIRDSASATNECWLMLSPNDVSFNGPGVSCSGVANNQYAIGELLVPCTPDGKVYFQLKTSGTNTMTVWLEVWGWDQQ